MGFGCRRSKHMIASKLVSIKQQLESSVEFT